jgi:hypothetical protein
LFTVVKAVSATPNSQCLTVESLAKAVTCAESANIRYQSVSIQQTPKCGRCQRFGDECLYRDNFELIHRDQTNLVGKRAREKWRERATGQQSMSRPTPIVNESIAADINVHAWPKFRVQSSLQPRLSFNGLAIPRFMFDFGPANPQMSKASGLAMLPQMYADSPPGSILRAITTSVALANFAGRFKHPEAGRAAVTHYVTALRLFAIATEDADAMKSPEALLSVFLFGLYEVRA